MKRSEKFKKLATRSLLSCAIWAMVSITLASIGWAYRDGWMAGLCGIAAIVFAFALGEFMNKRRLSKAEGRYEYIMSIRHKHHEI